MEKCLDCPSKVQVVGKIVIYEPFSQIASLSHHKLGILPEKRWGGFEGKSSGLDDLRTQRIRIFVEFFLRKLDGCLVNTDQVIYIKDGGLLFFGQRAGHITICALSKYGFVSLAAIIVENIPRFKVRLLLLGQMAVKQCFDGDRNVCRIFFGGFFPFQMYNLDASGKDDFFRGFRVHIYPSLRIGAIMPYPNAFILPTPV